MTNERRPVRAIEDRVGVEAAARAALTAQLSMVITDALAADQPIVWANDAFARLTGYGRWEVIGMNCRFLQGPSTDQEVIARLSQDLRAGRTTTQTILNYHRDGTPFWNRLVITPIRNQDGVITHHLGIQTDATDQVLADRARLCELEQLQHNSTRLDLVAQVGDALSRLLDFDQACDTLLELVVPALATWGFLVMFDEKGTVNRFYATATDPTVRELTRLLALNPPQGLTRSPDMLAAMTSTSDDILMPNQIDPEQVAAGATRHQFEVLKHLGLGSWLTVPLFARDQVLGMLVLVHTAVDGFDVRAVVTATHLGRRAGVALDNVRLYQAERISALTLQHRLLPRPAQVSSVDLAASYLPAGKQTEVGGDWFDVMEHSDGALTMVVGDVVGHDIVAAAAMGQVSSLLRARAWGSAPPARVLTELSALLHHLQTPDVASCVVLRWRETMTGARVEYSNAGHPAPVLRRPDGTVAILPPAHTLPIGLAPTEAYQQEFDIPSGSILVCYTDGLVERRDRPLQDGLIALTDALRAAPGTTAAHIRDHLLNTLVDEQPEDDICLLVVRCP